MKNTMKIQCLAPVCNVNEMLILLLMLKTLNVVVYGCLLQKICHYVDKHFDFPYFCSLSLLNCTEILCMQ